MRGTVENARVNICSFSSVVCLPCATAHESLEFPLALVATSRPPQPAPSASTTLKTCSARRCRRAPAVASNGKRATDGCGGLKSDDRAVVATPILVVMPIGAG
jgi:hypothetical protein